MIPGASEAFGVVEVRMLAAAGCNGVLPQRCRNLVTR